MIILHHFHCHVLLLFSNIEELLIVEQVFIYDYALILLPFFMGFKDKWSDVMLHKGGKGFRCFVLFVDKLKRVIKIAL